MKKSSKIGSFLAAAALILAGLTAPAEAAGAPCTKLVVSLSLGSTDAKTGGAVSKVQDFLRAEGHLDHVSTGYFGPITFAAVKSFQTKEGIEPIGIVGPKTRAAIERRCASPVVLPAAETTPQPIGALPTLPPAALATIPAPGVTMATPFEFDPAWRDAIVNIICTDNYGGSFTSGSGVVIDPRGIILTNAHVGVGQLFTHFPASPQMSLYDCQVRTGSPAQPVYRAELLYLPGGWVEENVKYLYLPDDQGYVYGKDDYALLMITGRTDPKAQLPAALPYLPIAQTVPRAGAQTYIVGYPGGFLGGIALLRNLYITASPAVVESVEGVGGGVERDIISFKGTIAGQHGTSGGAVISEGGKLAAMPTYTNAETINTTDDMDLHTITMDYISRDLTSETGMSLAAFLAQDDLKYVSEKFMREQGASYQRMYANIWKEKQGIVLPGVTY